MDLTAKTVVVTGGSRGIGLQTAKLFAQKGAKVIITARHPLNEMIQSEIEGLDITYQNLDVQDEVQIKNFFSDLKADNGIDVLVNNAGITDDGLLSRMKLDDFKKVLDINLTGTFLMTKHVMKIMQRQKSGSIINISSVSGTHGNIGQANYAASKAGIIGLTKTTAKEGALRNISCNAIAPGMIKTAMTAALSDKATQQSLAMIPMGRFGDPKEVAQGVVFLAENEYITGQVLTIDGGMTI